MKLKFLKKAVELIEKALALPKYGKNCVPLSKMHDYFQKNNSPVFWKIIPYYVAQEDIRSCSVASTAAVVNALRSDLNLDSSEELASHQSLLERVPVSDDKWKLGVKESGKGITLDLLAEILPLAFDAFGIKNIKVRKVHFDGSKVSELISDLNALENSAGCFIIANFSQCVLNGDPQACGGHFSPIGGYDSSNRRILILDVDRHWYEPYWVSFEKFSESLSTEDTDTQNHRGYIFVSYER